MFFLGKETKTKEKRIIEYFLDPFLKYKSEGLREVIDNMNEMSEEVAKAYRSSWRWLIFNNSISSIAVLYGGLINHNKFNNSLVNLLTVLFAIVVSGIYIPNLKRLSYPAAKLKKNRIVIYALDIVISLWFICGLCFFNDAILLKGLAYYFAVLFIAKFIYGLSTTKGQVFFLIGISLHWLFYVGGDELNVVRAVCFVGIVVLGLIIVVPELNRWKKVNNEDKVLSYLSRKAGLSIPLTMISFLIGCAISIGVTNYSSYGKVRGFILFFVIFTVDIALKIWWGSGIHKCMDNYYGIKESEGEK